MTYTVSSGTLNSTIQYNQHYCCTILMSKQLLFFHLGNKSITILMVIKVAISTL